MGIARRLPSQGGESKSKSPTSASRPFAPFVKGGNSKGRDDGSPIARNKKAAQGGLFRELLPRRESKTDSRFPIPDSRFPIPDSRFPIPDSRFPHPIPAPIAAPQT